jgi:hypothetical protein
MESKQDRKQSLLNISAFAFALIKVLSCNAYIIIGRKSRLSYCSRRSQCIDMATFMEVRTVFPRIVEFLAPRASGLAVMCDRRFQRRPAVTSSVHPKKAMDSLSF